MPIDSGDVTIDVLHAFAEAWHRHDADALMTFMTNDCVFDARVVVSRLADLH